MHRSTKTLLSLLAITCGGCGGDGLSPREDYSHNLAPAAYQQPDLSTSQPGESPAATGSQPSPLAIAAQVPIRLPMRVAVAQVGEVAPPESMLEEFRHHKALFNRVEPISAIQCHSLSQVQSLRAQAAEQGFSYLLVYGGNVDRGKTPTPLEVFNLTIIGLFVVPSDHIWANGKAVGSLIDVATGKPAMNLSVDARGSAFLPTYLADHVDEAMTNGVRDELIRKMTDQTVQRLTDHRPTTAEKTAQVGRD
jgi:hypothetical protein